MRSPRRSLAALALLMLTLAVAACGGLSEDELQAQATAICTHAAAATDRVPVPTRPSEGSAFLGEGLRELRGAVRGLRALEPPDDLRDRYERAVDLADEEIALIARHQRAIDRGADVIDAFRQLDGELEPLLRQENAYWRGLNIPACVRR